MSATDLFTIVTPTLNSEAYLDETVYSVVTQAGDFHLRYHVQDGGSSDGTLAILEAWRARLAAGEVPICCRGIEFSYTVSKDGGMYQAINRAFVHARATAPEAASIMGWINSDDRLAAGACATVLAVLADHPDIAFVGSRVSLLNDQGVTLGVNQPVAYDQTEMAAGIYDGRDGPFVMQEGTFWTSRLWDAVGGLDEDFRLAGDWDLWRRFAAHAPLVTIDSVLGFHRRRPGQLSEQMDRYYAEVDRFLQKRDTGRPPRSGDDPDRPPPSNVARFNFKLKTWELIPDFGPALAQPLVHIGDGLAYPAVALDVVAGSGPTEGPYPQWNLPPGIFWMNRPRLILSARVPFAGDWVLVVECRNLGRSQHVVVKTGDGVAFEGDVSFSGHQHDIVLRVPLTLAAGRALIEIESERSEPGESTLYLLMVRLHLEVAPRSATTSGAAPSHAIRRTAVAAAAVDEAGAKPWLDTVPQPLWLEERDAAPIDPASLRAAFDDLRLRQDAAELQLLRVKKALREKQAEINLLRLKDFAASR